MAYYLITISAFQGTNVSNPFVNTLTYLTTEVIPTSEGASVLADEIANGLVDTENGWVNLVTTDTTIDTITVTAPQVPSVLAINPIGANGTRGGGPAPRFVSWSFKQFRSRADMRHGFKRIGPISEADTAGDAYAAGMSVIMNGFIQKLRATQSGNVGGAVVDFTPIIVKRIPYISPSGKQAYRLPEGLDPFVFYPANGWVFDKVTSQNSRKV